MKILSCRDGHSWLAIGLVLFLVACSSTDSGESDGAPANQVTGIDTSTTTMPTAERDAIDTPAEIDGMTTRSTAAVLVFGDSLSSGYGLEGEDSWVDLLEAELDVYVTDLTLINASIGGETSSGGLERLPHVLARFEPNLMILQLGLNDAFRGRATELIKTNLETMAVLAMAVGAEVLILGERPPASYGAAYGDAVARAFVEASDNTGAMLVPSFLGNIVNDRQFLQEDGIHPNAAAQSLLLESVISDVLDLLSIEAVDMMNGPSNRAAR